jgi:hypothetical protein
VAQPRRFKPRRPNATPIRACAVEGFHVVLALGSLLDRQPAPAARRQSAPRRKLAPVGIKSAGSAKKNHFPQPVR